MAEEVTQPPRRPGLRGPAGYGARRRPTIKRLLPRTLFGRSLMIIVTPMLLMQAIATFYFFDTHWDEMTKRLAEGVAGEVRFLISESRDLPPAERRALFSQASRTMSLLVSFEPDGALGEVPEVFDFENLAGQITSALDERLSQPFTVTTNVAEEWVVVRILLEDGVLEVVVPRRRLFSSTSRVFILWLLGSGFVLLTVAIVFMRNQIRPIRRLAIAADGLGKGRDVPSLKPEGAQEVRQAARAFLIMQERIQRQITQRTEMLAGVSHDLRTPLTRMKLQLAILGDNPETEELRADVADMERMIEGYLAFARGEGAEPPAPTDLQTLLGDVVADARREGATIDFRMDSRPLILSLRPQAVRRCLANLLSNARRHADHIQVTAGLDEDTAVIVIDDDGPGIPEEQLEDVFRPFFRLDRSRNKETGGTGLGLTIARDVARGHGGDIALTRSPQGGLRCIIQLPL